MVAMVAGGICAAVGALLLLVSYWWDRRPLDRWGDRATNVRVVGGLLMGAAVLFVAMTLASRDVWG